MDKLKLLSTIFSKLGSLTKNNGQIIVTRDSKSLYVDLEGERIEITDWIDIDTEENLLAILTPLTNKYYYTKDSNKIWRYIGGEWKCLNDSADDLAPTYTESSTLLKLSSGEKLSVAFGKISKAVSDLISHIGNSVKHITSTERTNWNSAKTHADSVHARTDATKVEKSSTNGNIKINGTETTVYTHPSGTNPHGTTKSDIGLGNVGNFKAVSTVASQGLSDTEKSNARANIGAGTSSFSGSYNDLTNKPTIPTNNNQLTNGAGYITSSGTAKTISDTLPISKGGTGQTTGINAANTLINSLSTGESTPTDADYYISQYVGGGTTTTTYHRRPMSALWNYIKSKLATVATSGSYNDLKNKPTIPTVGNGTITITQNGTTKGTFTTNQSGNTTIALTDNNTTYGIATSSALGLVKSGTDITVDSSGNVSVNDDSHNHTQIKYCADILSNDAINNFIEAKTFKTAVWANTGSPGVANGIILSGGYTSDTYGYQLAIDDDPTYYMALRQKNGNGWSPWKRIPMGDGTGASGTWNINISGNATTATSAGNADTLDGNHASAFATASHTHNYLPLSGGTMTGSIKFQSSSLPSKELQFICGIDAFADGGEMGWQSKDDFLSNCSKVNHTHNYAGSSSAGGSATSAVKLDSSAGSATQPVYFSSGKPVACTYTLGKSVPSNAVFTDTNTWRPLGTTADTACAGNDSRLSNARPASDVYAWAKASSKPSYSYSEISGTPSSLPANGGTATASNYVNVNNTENKNVSRLQYFQKSGDDTIMPTKDWYSLIRCQHPGYSNGYWQDIAFPFVGGGRPQVRQNVNGTKSAWKELAYRSDIPSSLPANGGNSATVNGHTVNSDVPANAKFTDTNTWRPLGTTADTACAGNDSRLSNARPASDVYAWAKASSKPSYTAFEVGAISASQNTMLNAAIILGKNDEYGIYPNTNNYCQLGRSNLKFWKMYATNGYFDKINDGIPITSSNIGSQSVNYANKAGSAPASDVYSWAKASSKPSYSWSEITNKPSSFTPASHTHSYLPLTGGTVNGTITADDLRSVGGLSITCAYSSTASVACDWKDGSSHALVLSGEDGLSSYLGWSGSSSYATVTTIRGRTCKYSNSSGTSTLSDIRLKKDFRDLDVYDKFFDSIEPCAFRMKTGSSGRYHVGYKAQQIEQALLDSGLTTQDFGGFIRSPYTIDKDDPEGIEVYEEAGIKEGDDELSLIYTEFAAMNTYQIQKCKKEISNLKNEIAELKNIISNLNA